MNQIVYKYNLEFIANKIITPLYINLISESDIIFNKISNLKNIYWDDIQFGKYNLFDLKKRKEIKHESKILSIDIDLYDSEGSSLVCTKEAYYIMIFILKEKR